MHRRERSGVPLEQVGPDHPVGSVRGGNPPTGLGTERFARSGSTLEIAYIPGCSAGEGGPRFSGHFLGGIGLPELDLATVVETRFPAEKVGGVPEGIVHNHLPAGQEGRSSLGSGSGLATPLPSIVAARSFAISLVSGMGRGDGANSSGVRRRYSKLNLQTGMSSRGRACYS